MKRVLLLSLLTLPLLATPVAEAKGARWIKVCGPSNCTKTYPQELARSPIVSPPVVMSGSPDSPPASGAPWLQVRVLLPGDGRKVLRSVVAPRIAYAGGRDGSYGFVWSRLKPAEFRTYKRMWNGLERFPASTMPGLDGRADDGSGPGTSGRGPLVDATSSVVAAMSEAGSLA